MTDAQNGRFSTEWDSPPNPSYDLWTITNASEIVPGVLTPLLGSFTANAEERTFRRILPDYGGEGKVPIYPTPVPNFAGIFAGRIALNMGFTAALLSLVDPAIGEAVLQGFFTGVSGTERFIAPSTEKERAATAKRLDKIRSHAEKQLDRDCERLYKERATDRFERDKRLPLARAWARQEKLTEEAIDLFRTHLHVSLAASEYQVKLGGVLAAARQPTELVVPLCSGLGEVESSKPAVGLWMLAQKARRSKTVYDAIGTEPAASVLDRLSHPTDAGWRGFAAGFRDFLFRYGYRVQAEYDTSNPDWSEDPTFAISQVRGMLNVPAAESPPALLKKAKADRVALERQTRKAVPAAARPSFDAMLAEAQRFTRMREYSKAMWILGLRRGRATYLALGDGLVKAGVLAERDDLRFLVYDEIGTLATGGAVDGVAERVDRRKAQFKEAHEHVLPDTWVGEPEVKRRSSRRRAKKLTGLGVSGGTATGTARIVPDVLAAQEREIEPGDVLVAPFTDAPWTPLFIPAGAVVVETGGVLSHAATVAREFGIPCVVMVKDATRIIREGDTVTVDGVAGTVTISR